MKINELKSNTKRFPSFKLVHLVKSAIILFLLKYFTSKVVKITNTPQFSQNVPNNIQETHGNQ